MRLPIYYIIWINPLLELPEDIRELSYRADQFPKHFTFHFNHTSYTEQSIGRSNSAVVRYLWRHLIISFRGLDAIVFPYCISATCKLLHGWSVVSCVRLGPHVRYIY